MKLNWDAMRAIMLKVEALPSEDSHIESSAIEGLDAEAAAYHMRLLIEAGYARGGCREAIGPPWCYVTRLTWSGHELLDAIRRDSVWHRVRTIARERGVDLSFDVIMMIARAVIEAMVKS